MVQPRASSSLSWRQRAGALAGFLVVAVVATYPLVLQPLRALPSGLGDPLLNTTILAWNADRIPRGFAAYWDAPFFFPHHHTLAYSEHLLGIATFTAPLQWLTGNPVLVYNVAYFGSYALAGFGMFLLTHELWGRADAAALAGLMFAVTPYRFAQSTHLQVLMNGWMAVGLWALHRYLATGSRRSLAAFTAAFVLQGLSNNYYLYFFMLPVLVVIAVELVRPRLPRRRLASDLAFAGLCVAAVFAPIGWTYYQLQRDDGFSRTLSEIVNYSARLPDYFRVSSGGWTWGGLLRIGAPERELFHGFATIALALVGAATAGWSTSRDEGTECRPWRRTVVTYVCMTAAAVWLSMGPGTGRPYGWLLDVVPGLSGMRVPARLAAITVLGLAVLAGAGLAWLFERLPRRAVPIAALVVGAVVLLEGQHGVASLDAFDPGERSWDRLAYDWLRRSPPGAAVELPMTGQFNLHSYTLVYQYNTLLHRHPIVNGYSGWASGLQELLGGGASPFREPGRMDETLLALRAIGVRYVLLHTATYANRDESARVASEIRAARSQIAEEQQFGDTFVWRLTDAPPVPVQTDAGLRRIDSGTFQSRASQQNGRLPFAFDGDIDTRWSTDGPQLGTEWIEIRLIRPTDVGRVRIETPPQGLTDYPRDLVVESIDESGASRVLFRQSLIGRTIQAVAALERRSPVDLDLPPNRTTVLRMRQVGYAQPWYWSVHELTLWERTVSR